MLSAENLDALCHVESAFHLGLQQRHRQPGTLFTMMSSISCVPPAIS
jgi:hypothetical protein